MTETLQELADRLVDEMGKWEMTIGDDGGYFFIGPSAERRALVFLRLAYSLGVDANELDAFERINNQATLINSLQVEQDRLLSENMKLTREIIRLEEASNRGRPSFSGYPEGDDDW